ncbi:hypothetical protein SAMN04488541_10417 [Thermoflexibacter ruber]|uniref:Outer membrane protein beta-barrel domain-containing protein n=2 Tax=Thermoflexibacter ruber TaxID=1003 RepID=A0A1I2J256_9BACT|nr:hypothetical protein SAMN04488541_10417 [Thermoflexibacter ruber]
MFSNNLTKTILKEMKNIIYLCLLFLSTIAYAQEKPSTLDLKIGLGFGLINIPAYKLENELTKKWNRFFSSSISIGFAVGNGDNYMKSLDVIEGAINGFISPFGNQKKNNFKIGLGLAFIRSNNTRVVYKTEPPFVQVPEEWYALYEERRRNLNIIIDYERCIGKKYLIGARITSQPYFSIIPFLRFGIKL